MTSSSGNLLHAWCTQQRLPILPHLLHQHITNRFQHFRRSCYPLPPDVTSSRWPPSESETPNDRRRADELSDGELDEEEIDDGLDTEAGQVQTVERSSHLEPAGRVMGFRKKKTRTVFSRSQVLQLESTFDAKRYLSSVERSSLATALRLTETQVDIIDLLTTMIGSRAATL